MMPVSFALTIATRSLLLCALAMPACAQEGVPRDGGAAGVTHGDFSAELAQGGQHSVRGALSRDQDGMSLDATLDEQRNGNYRDGSVFHQRGFSGGAEWKVRHGRFGFSADRQDQDTRYPAPDAPYLALLAARPEDRYRYDVRRASAFVQRYVGNVELGVELSQREKRATAVYAGEDGSGESSYSSRRRQLSPRMRHYGKVGGVGTDTELGLDLMQWERRSGSALLGRDGDARRRQHSRALLLREELAFGGPHAPRLLLGLRHEQFRLDPADMPAGGSDWENQNAWDLQGSFLLRPQISVYAKAARSYRIDDDGYTSAGYRPLAGQLRREVEVGATFGDAARSASVRVFSERLNNQIVFDQSLGQLGFAGNLDPSRRDGIAIEASVALARDWRLDGQVRQVHARYDDYAYTGPDIALVPKTLATLRLYWTGQGGASADAGVQWLRALRYGHDFDNSCLARVPAFATLDARYARKLGAWELELAGSNLANRRHYGDAPGCRSSIYQNDARQLRVSARYHF
ncbi:TonB-dependent receptor [Janthinobacterium sp. SUN118]|uniref:TonB-dependent receptor domain-containing protein n=1 Tax=Janthinobacterium sp. SUN118 TaxID=3004100 RepID=UPI0025AF5E92|nr:TonB-dependent receptor [Janthinobacterium sp. SUN118]MDN2711922.1 TonB-dependent receptor [Janthinobacterium sp. SUN118]